MNEITDKNWSNIFPNVERALQNAAFITIDSEFSGINQEKGFKESLFDSPAERYVKWRRNIQPFIIMQFGITTFQRLPSENSYKVNCFSFYLLPRSVPFENRLFSWQVSAVEFLSRYEFDFNRVANEGISYLNIDQESSLKEQIGKSDFINNIEQLISHQDEDDLKDCKLKVEKWLSTDTTEASLCIRTATPIFQYYVHKELRKSFTNVWTIAGDKSIHIMKVLPTAREMLEAEEGDMLETALLESYVGFSKVFKLLTSLRKPIIGHNLLLDLMFMHQEFYKPLPEKYSTFKQNIHELFPTLYDTKVLSFELRNMLHNDDKWTINSLGTMYEYFKNGHGRHLALNSPLIKCQDDALGDYKYHNAGWDAYFTGYIFIKMAHIFALKKYGDGLEQRIATHSEIMSSIKSLENFVNFVRGTVSYLRFDGPEGDSLHRPEWLCVKSLNAQKLNVKEIAEKFSAFGNVDVLPLSKQRMLVAVSTHGCARDILKHYQHHTDLYVARYTPIRSMSPGRFVLWGGVVLSSGFLAWMYHRK